VKACVLRKLIYFSFFSFSIRVSWFIVPVKHG
jgi:hypothetical protein